MAGDDLGERTEAPTQRRREEARQHGQVARSVDLSSAVILLAGLVGLNILGGRIFTQLTSLMTSLLDVQSGPAWDLHSVRQTLAICLTGLAGVLLPLLVIMMLAGVLSNLMQVGFVLSTEPLKPELNKISPLAGLKKLFSKRSLVRLLMSLGKVAIIAAVSYLTIASRFGRIITAWDIGFQQVASIGGELVFTLCIRVAVVLLALALLDYLFQRWQHEQDLMMTREDLKEDLKRMEGDPQIRARRQRIARQLAMQRMSLEVPRASVVVTNPTHLAVAILYREGMNAPKVTAKGADLMAVRIRQIAAASGVPIVERKPLAQSLYKTCRIGDEVPVNLYKAVAEVLAYVYELARHKKIGRRIPVSVG